MTIIYVRRVKRERYLWLMLQRLYKERWTGFYDVLGGIGMIARAETNYGYRSRYLGQDMTSGEGNCSIT